MNSSIEELAVDLSDRLSVEELETLTKYLGFVIRGARRAVGPWGVAETAPQATEPEPEPEPEKPVARRTRAKAKPAEEPEPESDDDDEPF